MAISESVLQTVIKSGRDDLLRELMRDELKRLRDRRRYYNKKAQATGSDVDYDTLVRLKAQQNLIDEQINQIVKSRQNLNKTHAKSTAKLIDVAKQQKVITPRSEAFKEYTKGFDDNITATFDSMFGKGQFILSDSEIARFDDVFNKYGVGISDTIKRNIAKRYKHWSSDIAYQMFNEWVTKANSMKDTISDEDKATFNEYLNTVKERL